MGKFLIIGNKFRVDAVFNSLVTLSTLLLLSFVLLTYGAPDSGVEVQRIHKRQVKQEALITYQLPNGDTANVEAFREFGDGEEIYSILDGRKAQIYCNLSWPGPNKGLQVRWFKDDKRYFGDGDRNVHIIINETTTLINVPKVEVDKDVGKYRCAINDFTGLEVSSYEFKVVENDYPVFWTWLALAVLVIIIIVILGSLCFICKNRMRR